jgi:hypothetical protein
MKIRLKICAIVLLGSLANLANAQTAIQCVRSLVEPRGQGLVLKGRITTNVSDSDPVKNLAMTSECLASGFREAKVYAVNGQVEFLDLSGVSAEGLLIHQFDTKIQLNLYARLSGQSELPVGHYLDLFRQVGPFVYQVRVVNGQYFESLTWGVLPIMGGNHVH